MGQYRLWLHHREVDHLLQTQLLALEKDLAHLDERIAYLQSNQATRDNTIFRALRYVQQRSIKEQLDYTDSRIKGTEGTSEVPSTGSSALPDLSARLASSIPSPSYQSTSSNPLASQPSRSENLSTPSSTSSLSKSAQSSNTSVTLSRSPSPLSDYQPDGSLPPLIPLSSKETDVSQQDQQVAPSTTQPVDQQSLRTNQLVQRWFERRKRFAQGSPSPKEEKL